MFSPALLMLALAEPGPAPSIAGPAPAEGLGAIPSNAALAEALQKLPSNFLVAAVIPRPARLLRRATRELGDLAHPEVVALPRLWASLLEEKLKVDASKPHTLVDLGIDLEKPWTLLVAQRAQPLLLEVGITDPGRFEETLAAVSHARLSVAGRRVYVLADSGTEDGALACAVRGASLSCQLGLGPPEGPLAPLARALEAKEARLGRHPGIWAAASHLDTGADLFLVARAEPLLREVSRILRDRAARELRFAPLEVRRRAEERARAREQMSQEAGRALEGIALSVSLGPAEIRAILQLTLSGKAAALVQELMRRPEGPDPVTDWASTPSLAHLVARMNPGALSDLLRRLGLHVSPSSLNGTIAALALGLDTECRAAKKGAPNELAAIPSIFPTAFAVGLARPLDAPPGSRLVAVVPASTASPAARPWIDETSFAARFEARDVGPAILFGAGLGATSAATRRWFALPAKRELKSGAPALELEATIPAITAAIKGGGFNKETRPELWSLAEQQRRWQPILDRFLRVSLEVSSADSGRRVEVRGVLVRR